MATSILERIRRASRAFSQNPIDMKQLEKQLDTMIASGELPTQEAVDQQVEIEKQAGDASKLDIRRTKNDLAYVYTYSLLRNWVNDLSKKVKKLPMHDTFERDQYMSEVWREEPILAGAVYSMTAKMVSLKWHVIGRRLQSKRAAELLSRAAYMGGFDWGGFISATSQDFYTCNPGVFWETPKEGNILSGRLADIGHIDAMSCTLTGNSQFPMVYSSEETGQVLRFQPGEFIHFSSMPSARERSLGRGFCAVDRAFKAAQLLMGLHDYDSQKLDNLPPEGVAAVSGMTKEEFLDALTLWRSARQQNDSLTFPQVLWLLGSQPNAKVQVEMVGFSQLPESFDRRTVVDQYINTLALAFGVDAREFWTMTGGGALGSAGESEIQHLKAKGKGPGEFISNVERHINGEFPEGVDFGFDTQDIEEDASSAAIAKAWIDAFLPLYTAGSQNMGTRGMAAPYPQPSPYGEENTDEWFRENYRPDKPNGEAGLPLPPLPGWSGMDEAGNPFGSGVTQQQAATGVQQLLTKDQILRLLADKGVLPDWMVNDERIMIEDTSIHNKPYSKELEGHPDDITKFVWEKGIIKEYRLPPIVLKSKVKVVTEDSLPYASRLAKKTEERIEPLSGSVDFSSVKQAYEFLKEKEKEILSENRDIHGEPIPELESTRGFKPTRKSIHEELERWRNHPILGKYAMTADEEISLLGPLEDKKNEINSQGK